MREGGGISRAKEPKIARPPLLHLPPTPLLLFPPAAWLRGATSSRDVALGSILGGRDKGNHVEKALWLPTETDQPGRPVYRVKVAAGDGTRKAAAGARGRGRTVEAGDLNSLVRPKAV